MPPAAQQTMCFWFFMLVRGVVSWSCVIHSCTRTHNQWLRRDMNLSYAEKIPSGSGPKLHSSNVMVELSQLIDWWIREQTISADSITNWHPKKHKPAYSQRTTIFVRIFSSISRGKALLANMMVPIIIKIQYPKNPKAGRTQSASRVQTNQIDKSG